MWTPPPLIGYLRSLSFAGLVSAGLGAIIYYFLLPQLLTPLVGAQEFITFCGLLGAGLQQTLGGIFNNFLSPAGRYILYYERLLEVHILRKKGIISEEKYRHLVDKLTDERFLGVPPSDLPRQLPPGS